MVTTLILTHGSLARELLRAAEIIVGDLGGFQAVSLDWEDSFEEASRKTNEVLSKLAPQDDVLILTDMYGGTPYNVATSLARPGKIEVVTGVNLPMVVRLGCPRSTEMSVGELAVWIQNKARSSICLAGEGNDTANHQNESEPERRDD